MRRLIALILILLPVQSLSHQCVLRDTPHAPPVTLDASQINDDYCHCQDASDETATSACPNGTFLCANAAYNSTPIPSSWVRDGSCDCCDGSDEPAGACPDICARLRDRDFRAARQLADAVLSGVKTRLLYVKNAVGAMEKDARELRRLERELAVVENALNRSRSRAEGLRKRRDWHPRSNGLGTASPRAEEKKDIAANIDVDDDMYDYDYEGGKQHREKGSGESGSDDSGEKDQEKPDDGNLDPLEHDDKDDGDGDDDDYYDDDLKDAVDKEEDDELDDEDFEDLYKDIDDEKIITSTETEQEKDAKHQDEPDLSAEESSQPTASPLESEIESGTVPEPTLDVDAVCADLETAGSNSVLRIFSYARAVLLTKLNRMLPRIFPVRPGSAISGLDECIRQADSAKWKLESQKTDLEEKIKKLRKKQTLDYGSDKALRKLDGECTKSKVMQYEFEHCAFDIVRQYEHGSAIATLGRFDGWEVEDGQRYMKYANGDVCWNGPSRSIKVQLLCGEKEDIVSVDEPNRCTYFMKFRTPAVCEQEIADRIMSPFERSSEQKDEL